MLRRITPGVAAGKGGREGGEGPRVRHEVVKVIETRDDKHPK